MTLMILFGILGILLLWFVATYNGLIRLRTSKDNGWADIDVHLKKRHNLIPNLVNTVKGYAKHEGETLEKIIQARGQAMGASSPNQRMAAESQLGSLLPKINVLAEAYPDLKANVNFLKLQDELEEVETDIAKAREYFNAITRDYNIKRELFPTVLIAGLLGFKQGEFFKTEGEERSNPEVQF